jgi:hypothetical protein
MRTSARTIGQGARASFIHQEMTWQERSRPQFEASTGACHARTLCAPYLFEGRCRPCWQQSAVLGRRFYPTSLGRGGPLPR